MCGCVYVWVCYVWFCDVWVCVCVGFVIFGCFGNVCTCIYCVFVLFRLYIHIYIYLFIYSFCAFFNSVSYVFLLSRLCILIVMYVLFCTFYCHRANWHSSVTLTEVFPYFFLNCKANARVKLAKTGHGPHSSKLGFNCLFMLLFVSFYIVICVVLCTVCV